MSELREYIAELSPEALVFDNPSFDSAIIGISCEGAVIYSLDLMCEEFARVNECDYMEALEYIEYNTIRAVPYASGGIKPIIMDGEFFEYKEKEYYGQ